MGPSNSSYLSNIAIFRFHDYGGKSRWSISSRGDLDFFRDTKTCETLRPRRWRVGAQITRDNTIPRESSRSISSPSQGNLKMMFLFKKKWDTFVLLEGWKIGLYRFWLALIQFQSLQPSSEMDWSTHNIVFVNQCWFHWNRLWIFNCEG